MRQESQHRKVEGGESRAEPQKLKGGKKCISTSFVLHLRGARTASPHNLPFGVESYDRSQQEKYLYHYPKPQIILPIVPLYCEENAKLPSKAPTLHVLTAGEPQRQPLTS